MTTEWFVSHAAHPDGPVRVPTEQRGSEEITVRAATQATAQYPQSRNCEQSTAESGSARALTAARLLITCFWLSMACPAFGQTDPWSTVATRLATAFTGPIAKGFALVAIVVGGLQLAFSEGGGRRALGGLLFGVGLAMGATQVMTWLFS